MRIKEPGFYALPDNEYFSDPCPKPSLTQSLAKILLFRSPRHMWHAHPRLNPKYSPDDEKKYDLGTVAHALLFGAGKDTAVIDAPDWRTKAAREAREKALSEGKQPVLAGMHQRAKDMVDAFQHEIEISSMHGQPELAAVAEIGGTWLRTRMDWVSNTHTLVIDYKTTSQELQRSQIHNYGFSHGWHIQAAMHERILDFLQPNTIGRRQHFFVLQESYPPFASYKCRMSSASMELGRQEIDSAIEMFSECLTQNRWPGPSDEVLPISPPNWAVNQDYARALDPQV